MNLVSLPGSKIESDAADRKDLGYQTVPELGRCIRILLTRTVVWSR